MRDVPERYRRCTPVAEPATPRFRPGENAFLLIRRIDLLEREWHAIVAQVKGLGLKAVIGFRAHVINPVGSTRSSTEVMENDMCIFAWETHAAPTSLT